jgi:DNA invertase Pin-like site-specific DNA recombinase
VPPETCALYARVSTIEQSVENQLPALRKLAEARGWPVALEVEETESGARDDRPGLSRVLAAARNGVARVVVVWALDRLSRSDSILTAAGVVLDLDRMGVRVVSLQEAWLDTDPANPVRELLLVIFAWVARHERRRLLERQRAGIARAKAERRDYEGPRGTWPLGRRPKSLVMLHAAYELVTAGQGIRAAARAVGVSEATLRRFLAPKGPPRSSGARP